MQNRIAAIGLTHRDVSRPENQQPVFPQLVADPDAETQACQRKRRALAIKPYNGKAAFENLSPRIREFKGMIHEEVG